MNVRHDMINCFVVRPGPSGTFRDGNILQLRRAPGETLAGLWSTVRGKVEGDEKAWEAALRELREETGLVPIEFYQLDTIDQFYLAADDCIWHCAGFCAVVSADDEIVMNEEHDAFRWTARADIDQLFIWPGERLQLAEAGREILDNGPAKAYLRIALTNG